LLRVEAHSSRPVIAPPRISDRQVYHLHHRTQEKELLATDIKIEARMLQRKLHTAWHIRTVPVQNSL
jgi:hypothetical protein